MGPSSHAEHRGSASVEARSDDFPFIADEEFKMDIVRDWQATMHPDVISILPCAICAQRFRSDEIELVDLGTVELAILRNEALPREVLPTTYNLSEFQNAILYPKALRDCHQPTSGDVCSSCLKLLRAGVLPENALANFQYYAYDELPDDVRDAFARASIFDLMLVARARTTRISYFFNHKVGAANDTRQGFIRGNVAVLPPSQDTMKVRDVIPPSRTDMREAFCALFVSSGCTATRENVQRLGPVLVNKGVVRTLVNFLVEHNPWYRGQVTVAEGNIDDLYEGNAERALPSALEIGCLNMDESVVEQQEYRPAYVDEFRSAGEMDTLVVESIGYTAGDHSPANFQQMKAAALAHCLDGYRFLRVRSGSTLINEQELGFMTWAFPHLDPFGIGGFNNPNRKEDCKLSFARQLRNLLRQDESRFARDPNFAYVCWNILQRKELNQSLTFRVPARERTSLGQTLYEIASALSELMKLWQTELWGRPKTELQKMAFSVLARLQGVSRHVRGTTGYKQSRRNELRGLMREFGTPALFVTINPADLYNPLFGIYGGVSLRDWQSMSLHDRAVFIASHPHVAAMPFNKIVEKFLMVVVRLKHRRVETRYIYTY
ncbi:hypothetical protein OG21DRAFT_1482850 [Imleria badia]|nr:hypothetical protein OG21DRAFT_1482850 [Imleria badia]